MRYFLNIRTNDSLVIDEEGDVFGDIDQLYAHATSVVSDLEREYPAAEAGEWSVVPVALEVTDETGALIFTLPISRRRNPGY
jgi:hypothetical protein